MSGYGYSSRRDAPPAIIPADRGVRATSASNALGAGHVMDASAGRIRSNLLDFMIELDEALLTVTDRQTVPVERVLLGRLGPDVEDYGIEIYDELGVLQFGAAGAVVTAANIEVNTLSEITDDAGIIVAGQLIGASVTLDLDAVGANPVIESTNLTINANGSMTLGNHMSVATNGNVTFSGALSAASGTFSGTVSAGGIIATGNLTASVITFSGQLLMQVGEGATVMEMDYDSGGFVDFRGFPTICNGWRVAGKAAFEFTKESGSVSGSKWHFQDVDMEIDNDLILTGDLDHNGTNVGFYGTAPIAKQTGVAVSSAGIHAALVSLGLIAA